MAKKLFRDQYGDQIINSVNISDTEFNETN